MEDGNKLEVLCGGYGGDRAREGVREVGVAIEDRDGWKERGLEGVRGEGEGGRGRTEGRREAGVEGEVDEGSNQ